MPKVQKSSSVKHLHPNSRQACVIRGKVARDQKLDKRQKEKSQKVEVLGEKLAWFHDNTDTDKKVYTKPQVCELIESYLHRFDEELEQIEIVNGLKGRTPSSHVSRKGVIRIAMERERREFESVGLDIPDLTNAKNFAVFREWNREMRYVQNIKMRRYTETDAQTSQASKEQAQKS